MITARMTVVALLLSVTMQYCTPGGAERYRGEELLSDLTEWVWFLASDEMKGRANGSPEMELAANYIADIFINEGLEPGFGDQFIREYNIVRRGDTIVERNVSAILPGGDPRLKDEYIIITAHFDHIGIGRPVDGDSIYNGANDNASGTASMMGVARALVRNGIATGRSIVFVAVSGEEIGMRGSRNYVSDPPIDLAKAYLNLNLEMTGHATLIGANRFYMTGASMTNIDSVIYSYNSTTGSDWVMDNSYPMAERLFRSSDNISFATIRSVGDRRAGVPSTTLCLHTGEDHLHRPWDKPEFIDYENMAGFTEYVTGLVVWLSNSDKDIRWSSDSYVRYPG